MRLFIAVHLPESLLNEVGNLQEKLKAQLRSLPLRWTRPDQLHLTLRFLGHLPESELEALRGATRSAAQQSGPPQLTLTELGCFPNGRRPRVLWLGLGGDLDTLAQLQGAVLEKTRVWGEDDCRPFHPHLSLARIKDVRPRQARQLADTLSQRGGDRLGGWMPTTIELMQSELSDQGAHYRCLESFPLAQAE